MDDDLDELTGEESGSKLRELLKAAKRSEREWKTKALAAETKDLIQSKGFKYVKPEDLSGVEADELEAKAAEIEGKRAEERKALLAEVLGDTGLEGAQLDTAVASLLGDSGRERQEALSRIRDVGRAQGAPAPTLAETEGLYGESRLLAAFTSKAK